MRRLIHLPFCPAGRLARLVVAEKRLACDGIIAEGGRASLPVFVDLDGMACEGLWAIIDRLEGHYPERPLVPENEAERHRALRWLDWAMGPFHESVTRRIVHEKAAPRYTGAAHKRGPDMNIIREGRGELQRALGEIGAAVEPMGYLAGRDCSLGDLAVAAHLSALDYFGEVKWRETPASAEWYVRVKSRPSFRALLADRVPGQPPVSHYADLDF